MERPILFNDAEVRAYLDGRKTQLRRPIKPQPDIPVGTQIISSVNGEMRRVTAGGLSLPVYRVDGGGTPMWFPYQEGDRLWVRECWKPSLTKYHDTGNPDDHGGPNDPCCGYRATMTYKCGQPVSPPVSHHTWKSSTHMPRWASRLTLEVVDVRVERIQDITEQDAMAEGVMPLGEDDDVLENYIAKRMGVVYKPSFSFLWDSIYAAKNLGWDDNPWVRACTFRRLTA